MKTGIVICSYNMPEYTDALVEHIRRTVRMDYELMVFDNGSDLVAPSRFTTFVNDSNIQMVPGFMKALRVLEGQADFDVYWLLTTSCRFDELDDRDPLEALLEKFEDHDTCSVQPSLITTFGAWKEYLAPVTDGWREVHSLDYVATLYRAEYFDQLGGWNEALSYGWGFVAEIYYLARQEGLRMYTHDGYVMYHDTAIGYKMKRMRMSAEERSRLATEQANGVLNRKYRGNWRAILNAGLSWNPKAPYGQKEG